MCGCGCGCVWLDMFAYICISVCVCVCVCVSVCLHKYILNMHTVTHVNKQKVVVSFPLLVLCTILLALYVYIVIQNVCSCISIYSADHKITAIQAV